MGVRFNVNPAKLEAMILNEQRGAAHRAAVKTQGRTRGNILSSGRIHTGRMLNSIRVRRVSPTRSHVYSTLFYAMFQERGIGPVRPVKAKVLAFTPKGSGKTVFAMRTKGFPGAFFFQKAHAAIRLRDFIG